MYLFDEPGNRYIYYLITKQNYWEKPTYEAMNACLATLRNLCLNHGTKTIAMPRIGCGLDRLKWENVRAAIQRVFNPATGINVTIYSLDN